MADIARMLESGMVVDEFTSLWDRACAQDAARSIFAYIRSHGLQNCVFVSCYHDFLGPQTTPDWVFDAKSGTCRWFDPVSLTTTQPAEPKCVSLDTPRVDLWLLRCDPEVCSTYTHIQRKKRAGEKGGGGFLMSRFRSGRCFATIITKRSSSPHKPRATFYSALPIYTVPQILCKRALKVRNTLQME